MTQQEQIAGQSVSLVAAALLAGKPDRAVWAALDRAQARLERQLDAGRTEGLSELIEKIEVLTAEIRRRQESWL